MELDTKTPPYLNSDRTSFAYISAKDRWPIIVTQAIDDVFKTVTATTDPVETKEGRKIIEELGRLKYELQHDRAMTPIVDDGESDIAAYNAELASLNNPTWFAAPWLYTECYMYRRIHTSFSLTTHWKAYDIFRVSKHKTFRSSLPAVLELAHRYPDVTKTPDKLEAFELLFREIFEICLWGNATDLSLLTTLSYEDIQNLQGSKARKESEKNIIANDLSPVFALLHGLKSNPKSKDEERRVDIVLDNSGFELYVDLLLAGFLLSTGLATTVILHPKSMPWFVSDVLPGDFASLLNALNDPKSFFGQDMKDEDVAALKALFANLAAFHAEGQLVMRPNRFWTHGGSFWRLPAETDLWEDLKESELVIFKGDLNYRKLTGDAMWDTTTPFTTAIGPLGPGCGMRTLALRTCKADVVVGLEAGVDEKLRQLDAEEDKDKRKWTWSGKYAVVQFCDGKK